jgi:metallo-beta-lactamase class B
MMMKFRFMAIAWSLLLAPCLWSEAQVKEIWTRQITPFRIADNLYYVGSEDLAAYLVTTPSGNILINVNLPSSTKQIRASVEQLGFHWSDTKILLVGHAHFDHAGGAAEVKRETGAKLEVMEYDAEVVESGGLIDFLLPSGSVATYPPAHVDKVLHDGDLVRLGGVTLTAHRTGGHTRGCTTWTMRVHLSGDPRGRLRDVVIVGGYTLWSDYSLVAGSSRPVSYPGIADDFQHSFAVLEGLSCDIFLADHGEHFGLLQKLARMPKEGAAVWIDPQGYRKLVEMGKQSFMRQLSLQQKALN